MNPKVEAQLKRIRLSLSGLALALVTASALLWLGASLSRGAESHARGAAVLSVHAARSEHLSEVMRMRMTSVKGKRIVAQGSATGSVAGAVSFVLMLSSASEGSATFYGHNSRGTMTGTGISHYRVSGTMSYFGGSVASLRGTGRYAHTSNLGIRFSGTVNRRTYQVTMRLDGSWRV